MRPAHALRRVEFTPLLPLFPAANVGRDSVRPYPGSFTAQWKPEAQAKEVSEANEQSQAKEQTELPSLALQASSAQDALQTLRAMNNPG